MNKKNKFYIEYNAQERTSLWNFVLRNLREMFVYRYAIYNFVNSNLRARYRRSVLGFFWSLLNPLFTMLILSVVFSTIFKSQLTNFSIYVFSGLLPWNMIFNSLMNGAMSLVIAEVYLKKIYVPRLIFPVVTVGVELINFLLSLLGIFIIAIPLGVKVGWSLLALPFALILITVFLLGLVMIVSIVNAYFRDLFHMLQVALMGLFYLTPVVYPLTFVSNSSFLREIIFLNPFSYFVEIFHKIIYLSEFPDLKTWLICIVLSCTSFFTGLLVFSKREKDVIYRL